MLPLRSASQPSRSAEHLRWSDSTRCLDHHVGDRLVGAAVVAVDAEVLGSASDVLARLDAWFVDGHHLRRDRLRDGRGVWTKRRGVVGRTVRSVRLATGEGRLGRVRRVCVSTSDTGTGTTVMRVEVDQSRARRSTAAGTAVAGMATASTIVLAVVAGPVLLVATPVGLVAVVGLAGGGRARADAVALEIDRVLDAVNECVAPTRLRADIARRAGRQDPPFRRVGPYSPATRRAGGRGRPGPTRRWASPGPRPRHCDYSDQRPGRHQLGQEAETLGEGTPCEAAGDHSQPQPRQVAPVGPQRADHR